MQHDGKLCPQSAQGFAFIARQFFYSHLTVSLCRAAVGVFPLFGTSSFPLSFQYMNAIGIVIRCRSFSPPFRVLFV